MIPAAAGEADIRSHALAAGWRPDAVGWLVCPHCQQRNPGLWATYPLARQHLVPGRPGVAAQPAGIPPEAVPHETMTTRPPPGTGPAIGRRALAALHY